VSIMGIPVFMKTIIAIILMTAVSLTTSKSQAQTVRDDSGRKLLPEFRQITLWTESTGLPCSAFRQGCFLANT